MTAGYLIIPRAVLESDWWRAATPFTRNLWLVLYAGANWRPGTTSKGQELQPGQLVTSWQDLARRCSWVENKTPKMPTLWKVRCAADYLRKVGEVAWTTAGTTLHTGLVATLVNWALYANGHGTTADTTADTTAERLRELPQHMNIEGLRPHPNSNSLLRDREEWLRQEREGWEATPPAASRGGRNAGR